jgi:mannosyltransferase
MSSLFHISRLKIAFPAFLVLLNIIIRLISITQREISLDEPFSIYHSQFPPADIFHYLKNYNNPPLFEIVLHYWIRIFGIDIYSVRILPAIFSIFASFAIYKLGVNHFSFLTGVLSSLLLTFSSLAQSYAHDCRAYSLFLLLSILSMNVFLSCCKTSLLKHYVLFFLISVLNIYTHYFAFVVLFIQGVSVLLFYQASLRKFILASVFILLTYLPQLFVLLTRYTHTSSGTWLQPPQGVESLYNMLWSFSNQPAVTVINIFILVILLLVLLKKQVSKELAVLLLWFFVPFFCMFFISFKIPMYIDRYLIFVAPGFYLILSNFPEIIFKNATIKYTYSIAIALSFLISFRFNPWPERQWSSISRFIIQEKTNKSIVLVRPPDMIENFAYHYNKDYFKLTGNTEYGALQKVLSAENIYFIYDADAIPDLRKFKKVIYLDISQDEEHARIVYKTTEQLRLIKSEIFKNGFYLSVYE